MQKIKIAKVKPSEVLKVKKFLYLCWVDTYQYFPIETINKITSKWHHPKILLQQVKHSDIYFAKASTENNEIVGVISLQREGSDRAKLNSFYVHPQFQRIGIGSLMWQHLLTEFPNIKKVHLQLEEQNFKGKSFYKKLGFRVIEIKEEEIEGNTYKLMIMEKEMLY